MRKSERSVRSMSAAVGVMLASLAGAAGPDVIVGDLPDFSFWGTYQGISAFSIGTTSCNIGNAVLRWVASTNQHPVIGQNLYRYSVVNGAGRYEQIGQSFLKHGFTALNGTVCGACSTHDGNGSTLDPTCSDPYSASLNGSQSRLGPKSQVNAFTGHYPYPFTAQTLPSTDATGRQIARRLQVRASEVNPTLNPGAIYFAEGHYIASDDAAAGNGLNNAGYRRVRITGTDASYTMSTVSGFTTQRQKSAIYGWQSVDPEVVVTEAQVPGEGMFYVASRVTPIAGGMYHYEYAIQNFNSDRSGASFTLNLDPMGDPSLIELTNIGFRDVDYHSGEPYSGTDWATSRSATSFRWGTEAHSVNANANALRWSTMYTFRFDSDRAPAAGTGSIGLFKPGQGDSITFPVPVPSTPPCIGDHNEDAALDGSDVEAFFGDWENGLDRADKDRSGGVDGSDVEMFFIRWADGC